MLGSVLNGASLAQMRICGFYEKRGDEMGIRKFTSIDIYIKNVNID